VKRYRRLILLLLLLCIGVGVAWLLRNDLTLDAVRAWLDNLGWWVVPVFVLSYVLATVLFLPGTILTLLGGLLFGVWWGSLITICAATAGATLAFCIARYTAADWVRQRCGKRLQMILHGVEREGWRFVAVLRLMPWIPFNLLNYALGLTRIRLWHYVLASFVCMLPATIAYTYLGSLGQAAIDGEQGRWVGRVLLAVGLLVLVALLPWLIKKIRRGALPFKELE